MPKHVYQQLYHNVRRDIETHYAGGDRYLKVRDIAKKFGVSLQLAQKTVTQLKQEGVVTSKPRIGIIVHNPISAPSAMAGKKVLVLSHRQDTRFYTAFFDGIKQQCGKYDIYVEFKMNTFRDASSLAFGEYLLSLNADGIIALSFTNSALPFYFALREGQNLVGDVILDSLPVMPAVQTDNYRHSFEAAQILGKYKCRRYFVLGYYPQENKRFKGFYDGIQETWNASFAPQVTYIRISKINSYNMMIRAIAEYGDSAGFFISDYSANYFFGMLCLQTKKQPKFALAYDGDDAYFALPGIEPIRTVAPSFKELGRQLSDVLIQKWQTGTFPEPLQKKI